MIKLRSTARLLVLSTGLAVLGCERSPSPVVAETSPVGSKAPPDVAATVSSSPTSVPTSPTQETAIGKSDILVVSFISIGSGTDRAAYDRLQAMLKTLASPPPFVSHRWGREGEHDECFDLSALSVADRRAFIARVTAAIQSSDRVTITENGTCQEGR